MPFGPKEMPISTTPTSSIQPCGRDGRRLQQPRTGWGLQKDGKMVKLDFFRSIGKSTTEEAVVSYSSVAWVRRKLSGFPILLFFHWESRNNLENFFSPLEPGGVEFSGPIWIPARLFINLVNWAFVFGVPILYGAIYKFRKAHAVTTIGAIDSSLPPLTPPPLKPYHHQQDYRHH